MTFIQYLFILFAMLFCHLLDDYKLQGILANMKQIPVINMYNYFTFFNKLYTLVFPGNKRHVKLLLKCILINVFCCFNNNFISLHIHPCSTYYTLINKLNLSYKVTSFYKFFFNSFFSIAVFKT
jgi:hypothetical protein